MTRVLENSQPERVFYYFEELTKIPHCSGEEKDVSDYLVDFAKKHKFDVIQDEALNVVIRKPGTEGYENAPTIVLQGHMDMVCEKEDGVCHDFSKDPIQLKIDGDFIKTNGTTLGADNGIAVAMCLALLESKDISHPPIEVLVTTSEETGMDGAIKLDPKNISGRILINIDSEEEGKLLVSCAGGERNKIEIPIVWEKTDERYIPYLINISGLKGGHSGMEINQGRGNANKLMGRVLYKLEKEIDFKLSKIEGGSKTNAIPRSAQALIMFSKDHEKSVMKIINDAEKQFKNEFKSSDPEIFVKVEKTEENMNKTFTKETTKKIIAALMLIPDGIQTMSREIDGLVESSINLGIVKTLKENVGFESSVRSSVRSLKEKIANQMTVIGEVLGGTCESYSSYPEWEYSSNSYIREVFKETYKENFGKDIEIAAIHAGLECGLFKEKFKEMDMVSFGPNMYGVHTPMEGLSISSTQRTWKLLLEVLRKIS